MKKQITAAFMILTVLAALLSGCSSKKNLYQATWLDVFDTVTTLRGYDVSQEAFDSRANAIHEELLYFHKAFDIYNSYDGITNLKDVNDAAGVQAAAVDSRILDLVGFCKSCYELTGGKVNAAAGSMLNLWHEARTAGLDDPSKAKLPEMTALKAALKHCSFDTIEIDREAGTIFIADPQQRLDVGAIAKGWAGQQVRRLMPEGYLLSLGGNVCAAGNKPDGSPWSIGIQSPLQPDSILCIAQVNDSNVVTSGDYQRYYTVDGINYHHIIDPATCMPGRLWRGVTILCHDSGLADCLSTALFLLPLEEGKELARKTETEVLWINQEGQIQMTDGFPYKALS